MIIVATVGLGWNCRGDTSLSKLGQIELQEEMRRLRAVVETMQSVLPVDMQQRLQFFKTRNRSPAGRGPPGRSTSPLGKATGELAEISAQDTMRSKNITTPQA
eukprot:4466820-Amphidinium_carterae.1